MSAVESFLMNAAKLNLSRHSSFWTPSSSIRPPRFLMDAPKANFVAPKFLVDAAKLDLSRQSSFLMPPS